jgi:predicted RecB family nuclease
MIKHGLIHIPSWENNVSNGLDAMIQAYEVYNNPDINNESTVNDLIRYNHTDVRMIEKIINYLRKHHVPADVLSATVITTIIGDRSN